MFAPQLIARCVKIFTAENYRSYSETFKVLIMQLKHTMHMCSFRQRFQTLLGVFIANCGDWDFLLFYTLLFRTVLLLLNSKILFNLSLYSYRTPDLSINCPTLTKNYFLKNRQKNKQKLNFSF